MSEVTRPFSTYKILPESNKVVSGREGQTITFTTNEADQFYSFVFDDKYHHTGSYKIVFNLTFQ